MTHYFKCWFVCQGNHDWKLDGNTLGGIWIRCKICNLLDEYLPGVHEPSGGLQVWYDILYKDKVDWNYYL